jgi:glycosyltransferase involved in cell wall biosynthesis
VSTPVVIDGRAALRREIGGVERVARELAIRLPRLDPARYRVAAPPRALAHRAGHLWEQLLLPLYPAQVVYCPAVLGPVRSKRNVVCIYDAASVRHPEWYSRSFARYQRRLLPRLARRAQLVITASEFARAELVDVLGADPDRVEVIPLGVSQAFGPDADAGPARAAFGLERPYVLTVGSLIARKNLDALAHASDVLRREGIDLVVAGSGRGYMRPGEAALRELGYVDERLLPGLYAGAAAFTLPSLYEGFGLPALEAMASGVPVVASNRGALPEVCGNAALLVNPTDPSALAEAILAAAGDTGLRDAGLARARPFTWERTARETDALIERLL